MSHTNSIQNAAASNNLMDRTQRARPVPAGTTIARGSLSPLTASSNDDDAALSGAGSLLATAISLEDTRTDRVDEIRTAIQNGTYDIPAGDVADRLIHSMRE